VIIWDFNFGLEFTVNKYFAFIMLAPFWFYYRRFNFTEYFIPNVFLTILVY